MESADDVLVVRLIQHRFEKWEQHLDPT
jgi:hypothetical protein